MERTRNKDGWVKGSILSYDYVLTPNEIYFVKIAPTITFPLLSVVITVILVIVVGPRFFIPSAVAAIFI